MVTSVSAIAISGDVIAMIAERSARRSSTNCMARLVLSGRLAGGASAHQQSELLAGGHRCVDRLGEVPLEHHGDAVGNFGEFIKILADHQDRRAAAGEIEESLPYDGCGAGVDSPGRLAHHQHARFAKDLAADD